MKEDVSMVECLELPLEPSIDATYRLLRANEDEAYYWKRVDRNLGWITRDEQEYLRNCTIGVAGCGGMGGQLAEKFLRLGVGTVRIADNERFDATNINRQFGAMRSTIGHVKAFETAKMLRAITDDTIIEVYPRGITARTAADFVAGCDVVCDEIEFWSIGARLALHRAARAAGVPVFMCNTVGFGSHLFLFQPDGMSIEDVLGLNEEDGWCLESGLTLAASDPSHARARARVMDAVLRLFPSWSDYSEGLDGPVGKKALKERLLREGCGAIIATNPPLACGFAADRVLLHLLKDSSVARVIVPMPDMPGYLFLDAALMRASVVTRRWW